MESRIIIIFILVTTLSAAEDIKEKLKASEGGSITLPDPVMEFGFLSYGPKTVAMVDEGKMKIVEDIYRNRIHWNKNTGLFTITDLQKTDSGFYTVDSKKGRILNVIYKLSIFDPVPVPKISNDSVSSARCSLLCSVDRETTLSWYRDQEVLNRSSHAVSLPLTVSRKDFSSSYRCVASSPAENKTAQVVMEICWSTLEQQKDDNIEDRLHISLYVIGAVVPVIVVLVFVFLIKKMFVDQKKTTTTTSQTQAVLDPEDDVTYTDIHRWEERRSPAGTFPDPPAADLRTVYDKLEVHRMMPPDQNA